MSIQSEIERIQQNTLAAYNTINDKGGTVPQETNSANLAAAIGTIPTIPTGGLAGQTLIKATNENYATKWGPWLSNPGLLINCDFRNPVNRNGQSKYTGTMAYCIDRWMRQTHVDVLLTDNGLIIRPNSTTTTNTAISQIIEKSRLVDNATYTVSVLTSDNELLVYTFTLNLSTASSIKQNFLNVPAAYITISNEIANEFITVFIVNRSGLGNADLVLIAVKFELGDQQTLAHQDADGNWVLNDPPNYDLQYTLCSQYSPTTGEFVGSQHSNPNLLDNAYWAKIINVINQRGLLEYIMSAQNQYFIDRWLLQNLGTTVTLTNNGLKQTGVSTIYQKIEKVFQQDTVVTLSVLYKGSIRVGYMQAPSFVNVTSEKWNIAQMTYTIPAGTDLSIGPYQPLFRCQSADTETYFIAAKLEIGPLQTLAHKVDNETVGYDGWVLNDPPPNKALELTKCQRYQLKLLDWPGNYGGVIGYGFNANTTDARICIPTPTTMRGIPVMSFLQGSVQNLSIFDANGMHSVTSVEPTGNYNNQVFFIVKSSELFAGGVCILRVYSMALPMLDCNM